MWDVTGAQCSTCWCYQVCLVTDPRPTSSYGKAYTVDYLGNIVEGKQIIYNNQPPEVLTKLVAESIKALEPVWFGCEVNKHHAIKLGIGDFEV